MSVFVQSILLQWSIGRRAAARLSNKQKATHPLPLLLTLTIACACQCREVQIYDLLMAVLPGRALSSARPSAHPLLPWRVVVLCCMHAALGQVLPHLIGLTTDLRCLTGQALLLLQP